MSGDRADDRADALTPERLREIGKTGCYQLIQRSKRIDQRCGDRDGIICDRCHMLLSLADTLEELEQSEQGHINAYRRLKEAHDMCHGCHTGEGGDCLVHGHLIDQQAKRIAELEAKVADVHSIAIVRGDEWVRLEDENASLREQIATLTRERDQKLRRAERAEYECDSLRSENEQLKGEAEKVLQTVHHHTLTKCDGIQVAVQTFLDVISDLREKLAQIESTNKFAAWETFGEVIRKREFDARHSERQRAAEKLDAKICSYCREHPGQGIHLVCDRARTWSLEILDGQSPAGEGKPRPHCRNIVTVRCDGVDAQCYACANPPPCAEPGHEEGRSYGE